MLDDSATRGTIVVLGDSHLSARCMITVSADWLAAFFAGREVG